ncbi:dTMP kinase [Myxococcota bacterium]|nr:dTMP kinase [Myxococcota bacterium]
MRPLFIAVEGLDGSGGTTQVKLLADWLRAQGRPVHVTAEPSTGPVGRFIRQALADPQARVGDAVLPYLFAADRRDHLDREVLPALERGEHVVSDRYKHSSLAYQSLCMGLSQVAELNSRFRAPDLTLLLDLDPETCLQRILARGEPRDRFEALDRLRAVHDSYEAVVVLTRSQGERVCRVDAQGSVEQVHARVVAAVKDRASA